MDGVAVVAEILRADTTLVAMVPLARIKEDELEQNTPLPAIVLTSISAPDRNVFAEGAKRHVTERVQVTVASASVRERNAIFKRVRIAGSMRLGDYADVTEVSVLLSGVGPSFKLNDPTMYLKTQDFSVSYNELTA